MRKRLSPTLIFIIVLTVIFTLLLPSYAAEEIVGYEDYSYSEASELPINDGEKHWFECTKCGYKQDSEPHKKDNTGHWLECPECGHKTDTKEHIWNKEFRDWFIIIKETHKCTICSFSQVNYGPMFYILSGLMYLVIIAAVISSIIFSRRKAKKS